MLIETSTCQSVPAMFVAQADRLGPYPFLWAKRDGAWVSTSWQQTRDDMLALAAGLRALGLSQGDRVMIVAENRPEWAITDLAAMAAGGISVPAYITNTVADHRHILNNSGARFVVASTRLLAERIMEAAQGSPRPPAVICLEGRIPSPILKVMSWEDALNAGRGLLTEARALLNTIRRTQTACIIHTSGTGGAPKGVMLSHGALLADCHGAQKLLAGVGLSSEVFLSFLPLSHSYEHTVGLCFPISVGAEIYYAESIEHLAANMMEVRPTIMTAVPRLYEMMRGRITQAVQRQGGYKAKLFGRALDLGVRRYRRERLNLKDRLTDALVERLVRDKVRARFGGRLKALVSGGAPLSRDVGLFFTALGVRILQGYGQTEAGPAISCSPPERIKIDTVGPPLEGVQLRIAEDGEILVRGEVVMQGYWNEPGATSLAIREGWLHTGDVGKLDKDGYLRITDRKKDIIVNSGGDNISPQRIESMLTALPEISQAMVHGDRRPHLVALLVPDAQWADTWAREHVKPADLTALVKDSDFRDAIAFAVERVNKTVSTTEKVRSFTIASEPFTPENGMLTPTMKIRRHVIRQVYGERLDGMYR